MAGLTFVAASRPTFVPGSMELVFAVPAQARRGDVLLAILIHATADGFTSPTGWTAVGHDGASITTAHYIARMVDEITTPDVAVTLTGIAGEWQGQLVVLRGSGAIALLKEASATTTFATDLTPTTPGATCHQAINLLIAVWSAADAPTLSEPDDFDLVDSYSTALVEARTTLVAVMVANETGTLAPGPALASSVATGRSFLLVLRDTLPAEPATLFDAVPGNIGLLGKDVRPIRERAFA